MHRQTTAGRDGNARVVQLVDLLGELGPDVPEISRRLGQFKESVRYRYKEKILGRGFAVQAAVDHERLGLKRMMVILDFNKDFGVFAQSILEAMNELCYLVSYARTLPGGQYVVNVSAPLEFFDEIGRFFVSMRDKGMFSRLEILEFDWFRRVPMKADFYDFSTGRWDFDWSGQAPTDFASASYQPSTATKFDQLDLLIIKEMQMDANKSMKEISESLGLSYKKLVWHYVTHVRGRGMIRGYSVNWMGTRYDHRAERALNKKHRYFALELFVKDVSEYETMALRREMDKLPFLWTEAAGRNYFAEFAFPVESMIEGLQLISSATANVKERTQIQIIDQTGASGFTIPYALFDSDRKAWVFDRAGLTAKFESLLIKVKSGTT